MGSVEPHNDGSCLQTAATVAITSVMAKNLARFRLASPLRRHGLSRQIGYKTH